MPRTVASRAVRSYRTLSPLPDPIFRRKQAIGGLLSVALVVGSRPPGVTWHPALWSPDFPPLAYASSDCLGQLGADYTLFSLNRQPILVPAYKAHFSFHCEFALPGRPLVSAVARPIKSLRFVAPAR